MVEAEINPIGVPVGSTNSSFGTDGIRGRVDNLVTPALALQFGYWCGHVLPTKGPVLIGMDSRQSGVMLVSALTAGLTAAGQEVWNLGLCPTPAVPQLIKQLEAAGGLMVSASHNPPQDNGIKVFGSDGAKLISEQQKVIESGLRGEQIERSRLKSDSSYGLAYQKTELLSLYQEKLIDSLKGKRLDGLSIVLDLCWGSATSCAVEIFKELGAELTVLHGEPNGKLINVECGSTELKPLQKAVVETNSDMGFAFDGDADRVLAVDGKGRMVDGDHILYFWGSALKEQKALPDQRLVATVMSNLGFERAWIEKGGLFNRTPVGDQHVHAAMLKNGAGLGGEQSGHILSAIHGMHGDGLLTAIQLANICKDQRLSLTNLMDKSFEPFPQKLINIRLPNQHLNQSWKTCGPLQDAVLEAQESLGEDGRVLVRASGTEPLLRVMVEASDSEVVETWSDQLSDLAEQHLKAA